MEIFDISMLIEPGMPVYKNIEGKRPIIKVMHDYTTGNSYESKIEMDMHTGTHIDMPLHMINNGNTVEKLDLYKVITKCKVIDLSKLSEKITKNDLINIDISKDDFLLLKTRNSFNNDFDKKFIYLDKEASAYLSSKLIKGVGIDALGIERDQPAHETHITLLKAGIIIIEGLRLKEVEPGYYNLYALPLNILGAEASPARVILTK